MPFSGAVIWSKTLHLSDFPLSHGFVTSGHQLSLNGGTTRNGTSCLIFGVLTSPAVEDLYICANPGGHRELHRCGKSPSAVSGIHWICTLWGWPMG